MAGSFYQSGLSNVLVMRPGNRLRDLRKRAHITQEQLAELTGVSQPAISQIENGRLSMDIHWMRAFARILGCAPADLLDDEDNPDRLTAEERDLLARYRHANEAERRTLDRVTAAVVPIDADVQVINGGAAAA